VKIAPARFRAIPAGILDAGFASLATLAIGLYAARRLPVADLGAYSIFFSAYVLGSVVPTQLVLGPAGIASVSYPQAERLGLLPQTWRLGMGIAVFAGVAAAAAAWLGSTAALDVRLALGVTAAVSAILTPLQQFVRQSLHLGGASWRAAATSLIQLIVVVVGLLAFSSTDVPRAWHPMGSLAIANGMSLAFAFLRWGRDDPASVILPRFRVSSLVLSGRWLLLLEVVATGALFLSVVMLGRLAGAEALGHAEAARIVAQPLIVMAVGLATVLGPRSMEAGSIRDRQLARRISGPFLASLFVIALAYAAITALPWRGNPMAFLLPLAYVEPGLVLVSVIATLLVGVVYPYRSELLGARRERSLVRVAVVAATLQMMITAAAGWNGAGAFARPLGVGMNGAALWLGCGLFRSRLYREEQP